MLADKHTRNVHSLSAPSDHTARGVLSQDALARTPLWLVMMKPYPSANGHWDLKQADGNNSRQLALSPQVLICPPPLLGHYLMVTSLHYLSKVIIQPMKDGNEQNPPNPPRQDSPVPSLPCERTPQQPNPGPEWHLMVRGIIPRTLPNQRATYSLPESILPATLSRHSPLHNYHQRYARWIPPSSSPTRPPSHPVSPGYLPVPLRTRVQSSSHSHDDTRQELTNLRPTLMIPRAIVHESIN
ncbi:hypothetical protein O181_100027 [Austropuccinia psidii MF-1]|uniref:Uncharacterized protein n=1 Tax=Austropuccinia psidii MF-1 TaxID=1389203 RepID=A0A9Q3JEF2_9BASI|nr:hypothetical protein [Austropuccinia psidii MF-1]